MGIEYDRLIAYFDSDLTSLRKGAVEANAIVDNLEKRFKNLKDINIGINVKNVDKSVRDALKLQAEIVKNERIIEQAKQASLVTQQKGLQLEQQVQRAKQATLQTDIKQIQLERERLKLQTDQNRSRKPSGNKSNFGDDFLNSTFAGSLMGSTAGSLAGAAFTKVASEIIDIGASAIQTGGKIIQLGADFEQVRNSLAVFAGGANFANRELQAIQETVQNGAGLRLEPAEQGYRQLRALGFEAENSRKLIANLGKQRLLSGAQESDVQRIIVNLTQLSAGSSRASADIKEIFHAMPSLRKEFALAFGSLDPKKIAKAFNENPEKAIEVLTAQLDKAKGATGGLNDAWGKLSDEFTIAGRKIAEPNLKDLTKDIQTLTKLLRESGNAWTAYGNRINNFYNALKSNKPSDLWNIVNISNEESMLIKRARDLKAMSFEDYVKQQTGKTVDEIKTYKQSLTEMMWGSEPNDEAQRWLLNLRMSYAGMLNSKETANLRPEIEDSAKNAAMDGEIKLINEQEKIRQKELNLNESKYSEMLTIRRNYYAVEIAEMQSHLDLTLQSQLKTLQKVSQLKVADIRAQIKIETEKYNKLLELHADEETEVVKLTAEKNKTLSDLNKDLKIAEIDSKKEIAQKEREILLQRRADNARAVELEIREVSQGYDRRIAEAERAVEREVSLEITGYDRLAALERDNFNASIALLREQNDLKLLDESLSEQAKNNIRKEGQLDEKRLAEENRRRIVEIEDKKNQAIISSIQRAYTQFRALRSENVAAGKTIFESILGGELTGRQFSETIGNIQRIRSEFEKLNQIRINAEKELNAAASANNKLIDEKASPEETDKSLTELGLKRDALQKSLADIQNFKLQNPFSEAYSEYGVLADAIISSNFKILKSYEDINRASIGQEFKNQTDTLNNKYAELARLYGDAIGSGNTSRAKELNDQMDVIVAQLAGVRAQIEAKTQEFYKTSISGIQDYINDTSPYEKLRIVYEANQGIWVSAKETYQNIIALESEYYKNSEFWALKRKEAILEYEREIYEAEQNRLIQSQITISQRLRRQMAEVQDYSTIIKTYIGDLPTAFGDAFASGLQNWDGTWKGFLGMMRQTFASLLQDLAAQMLKSAIIKLVGSLIGSIAGGIGGSLGGGGSIAHETLGHIPGHATGGFMGTGELGIVGEKGPELFIPSSSGTVITNERTKELLGGGSSNTIINNFNNHQTIQAPRTGMVPQKSRSQIADATGAAFNKMTRSKN